MTHPKCNPFAYLTQIAYNVFRQRIKNEKKFMKLKQRLREDFYDEFETEEGLRKTKDNPHDDDENWSCPIFESIENKRIKNLLTIIWIEIYLQ